MNTSRTPRYFQTIKFIALFLLVCASVAVPHAEAATYTRTDVVSKGGDYGYTTFTASLDKDTYNGGDPITVSGKILSSYCANGDRYYVDVLGKNSADNVKLSMTGGYLSAGTQMGVINQTCVNFNFGNNLLNNNFSNINILNKTNTNNTQKFCYGGTPVFAGTNYSSSALFAPSASSGANYFVQISSTVLVPGGINGVERVAGNLDYTVNPSGSSCSLPWGGSIASGASVTAYQASSVISPATCVSESRTCTNGTLSGSYANQSCAAVEPCLNGASNPPACNQCPANLAYVGGSCVSCNNGGCTGPGGSPTDPLDALVCNNGANDPISCTPQASCSILSANPASVAVGGTVTLTWSCTNASSCTQVANTDGFSTGGALSGTDNSVKPSATSGQVTYGLTCGGTPFYFPPITILSPQASITAAPARVMIGGSSTISWSSSLVRSCVVSGPGLSRASMNGSKLVTNITTQSTYTIDCRDAAGVEIIKSVTVNILSVFNEF